MKKLLQTVLFFLIILVVCQFLLRHFLYPLHYEDTIRACGEEYDLDPLFIAAMIKTESNFSKEGVSRKDAKGLMQVQEETAQWCAGQMGLPEDAHENLFDPETNIRIGSWYYRYLLEEFGEERLALAAYNAGMGNVRKWVENQGTTEIAIPYPETEQYVKKVKNTYHIYQILY